MRIKKQFTLLVSFIVAIPLICILFLVMENYLHSPERYLIEGYEEVKKLEEVDNEYYDAIQILKLIPAEVQFCLVATDPSEIICNNIPELKSVKSNEQLWQILRNTSKNYFYQFTSPSMEKSTILITRIPRKKQNRILSNNLITTLLIIFSICIAICIFAILYISKTIFKSIIQIKNETKKIANGDLNEPIVTKDNNKNQNEIISILESIEKMRRSLLEAETRKNKFIMGISHDLRTPVAIIKGYTEAITDKVFTSEKEINEALTLVQTKTAQLENMINDLINFTKLNRYELQEQFEPYSITNLIKDFTKEAKLAAAVFKRSINLIIDLPENIIIPLNKKLIFRAFQNLFSNAIRYSNDGDKITILAIEQNGSIIIKLSDTGVGIKEEDLPHIFDLFYKSSNSRQEKSMGIGLSVVKDIFDIHGWPIDVSSKKGEGTCFTITIPYAYV